MNQKISGQIYIIHAEIANIRILLAIGSPRLQHLQAGYPTHSATPAHL